MWRKPLLQIIGPSGIDILPKLSGLWLEARVSDKAGQKSDTAEIVCVGPTTRVALPTKGTIYDIYMGWADEGLVHQGRYSVQTINPRGDPNWGETIAIELRAADFVDKLKASGREHYDNLTFGEIMKRVAAQAGMDAVVDPDLASKTMGYRLRWDQSLIDFATELAEEHGATVKPANGKLIVMKRGGGSSASGKELEPIRIRKRGSFGYDIRIEPRTAVGSIAAGFQDEASGKRKLIRHATGRDGPTRILPHPYRSSNEAEEAAKAAAYEAGHMVGEGYFEAPGLPKAWAEAPVIAEGYGPGIDGRWTAESVDKSISARGMFRTTVNIGAGKEQK